MAVSRRVVGSRILPAEDALSGVIQRTYGSARSLAAPGQQLGRYHLLHKLATGGMAEIFLAKTSGIEGFEKIVVLKRILPHLGANETFVSMFLDEARVAANLEHPNIVNVYDIGKAGEDYFFTMAYLHGEDLSAVLRESARVGRGIPLALALHIVLGVCAGLHYAHEQVGLDGMPLGIVHRDVSTTNVMLTYDGAVKLLDFGIAKAATQSRMTQVGVRKGKAAYMSPEQCRAEPLDRRSDVFAIGILLWELTTMRGLFRAESELAVMNMIVNHDAPLPSSVVEGYPAQLEAIVTKALCRDRELRYPTARALQEDLEEFVREYRLGTTAGALAELMRGLFGPKPLPWAPGGLLAQAGISLGPTPEPTTPGNGSGFDSSDAIRGASSTEVGPTPTPVPHARVEPSRSRAPLFAAAGALGTAALAAVLWVATRNDGGSAPVDPPASAEGGAAADPVSDGAANEAAVPAGPCPDGMVLVDGGSYFMGSDSSVPALAAAGPSHRVDVGSFCLDRHEVTVAEFHRCSDQGECKRAFTSSDLAPPAAPAKAKTSEDAAEAFSSLCNEGRDGVDDHPINCVTWAQAEAFCRFRGARLPTETEWEWAARGGDGRTFPWGDDPLGPERLNACGSECLAWFRRSTIGLDRGMFPASDAHVETSAVGAFPSGRGKGQLDDLAGNVAEWTADPFTPHPGARTTAAPEGARVVRGASFHSADPAEVDPAFRRAVPEGAHPHDVGIRCAADPTG